MGPIELSEQADGSLVVRGVSLEEARTRLSASPRARAARGRRALPAIEIAEIRAAVDELAEFDIPLTQVELAVAVGVSRRRLRQAIDEAFGSWDRFSAISATWPSED